MKIYTARTAAYSISLECELLESRGGAKWNYKPQNDNKN